MRTLSERLDRVRRLVCAATGEEWGDGYTVTNFGVGFAEPGYGNDDETIWVLGNWNPKRWRRDGDPPLTNDESMPERLADALTRRVDNLECEWLDEWITCDECGRIFRTTGDSYSWRKYGAFTEGGALCGDHVTFDDIAEDYINNPRNALTFDLDLETEGFSLYRDPEDPDDKWKQGRYESGWHPGQNDDPSTILARALTKYREGIFRIPSVGQFDIEFELWVRYPINETEDGQ